MNRTLSRAGIGLALGALLLIAGGFGLGRSRSSNQEPADPAVAIAQAEQTFVRTSGASLDDLILSLQDRLALTPDDYVSWATLGIAYVQQAKITVDPGFYPRAEGALERSIEINEADNFLGYAGLSALASARHDFEAAKGYAEQGLEINAYSAILYGALSDAEIQLGNYDAGFIAVQRMIDLSPDTSSLARASYTWELRGNLAEATRLMERARDDAPNGSDRAFALFYLGELAFNAGNPGTALDLYNAALAASPNEAAPLAGKAKAEAALGQFQTAIDHYAELVQRAPDPTYLIEYGELLESLGRQDEAQAQYDVVKVTQQLFEAAGVAPDATTTLFDAVHGEPERALAEDELGIATRPFLVMYDAYGWALHEVGRDVEALEALEQAMQLGTPSALFHYHAGMIKLALGDEPGAVQELTTALEINPYFNPLAAPIARATLDSLTVPA